jgi:hypothetical protein
VGNVVNRYGCRDMCEQLVGKVLGNLTVGLYRLACRRVPTSSLATAAWQLLRASGVKHCAVHHCCTRFSR